MKHASIVPLIGGMTLAQEAVLGHRPEYLLSYAPFGNNDSHIVNRLADVPYILLDEGGVAPRTKIDIIGTTCPCAGLSSLSPSAKSDAPANEWMVNVARYVLEVLKPKVLWGENAPRFAGEMGKPIVRQLHKIARANGYTMSIYKTKSILHGLSQVRERSFYFFWEGTQVPLFEYHDKKHQRIEDLIRSVPRGGSDFDLPTNAKTPTEDPFYKYVLQVMNNGMTHQEFFASIPKSVDAMYHIEKNGIPYAEVGNWMKEHGYDKLAVRCQTMSDKLAAGGNIMRRSTQIAKDYIGAFVGHLPQAIAHPDEDRYITYREAMSIMGLPLDFHLLNHKKNLNHVCQNVPVGTASDMVREVVATLEGDRRMLDANLVYQFNTGGPKKGYHELRDFEESASLDDFMFTSH